jgi:hypothetical protein
MSSDDELDLAPGVLVHALTAPGTPDELADQDNALAMFRASPTAAERAHPASATSKRRWLPRRRLPRWLPRRLAPSLTSAAIATVLVGGVAGAAYAAVLPAPVQRIAHHLLAGIGVPNPRLVISRSPAASATTAAPRPARPVPAPGSRTTSPAFVLVLTAARTQIPAGGAGTFTGYLALDGRPAVGVWLRLTASAAPHGAGRQLAIEMTDEDGAVTFTVPGLTSDTQFRLTGPDRIRSAPVTVTVVPQVTLSFGTGVLIATARYGRPGDHVTLQVLIPGYGWRDAGVERLGGQRAAYFTIAQPHGAAGSVYRVILSGTAAHAPAVSAQLRVR